MRTLHITTLLKEYLYKVSNNLIKSWKEFQKENYNKLRHFNTYNDAVIFVAKVSSN